MKIGIIKNVLTTCMAGCFYMAAAQTSTDQSTIKKDIKFAERAAKDGLAEVKLGQLAQKHGTIPEVKTHAQHMIDDHSKTNEELKTIANRKNIPLPATIDDEAQKNYDKLARLNGEEFDKKYSKSMIQDHKKAICLFKKESKRGKDPELKAWAGEKLPTLENHLAMWKEASKTAKK